MPAESCETGRALASRELGMRRRAPRTRAAAPNKAIPQAPTDASHLCAEGRQKHQTGHCPAGAPVGAGAEAGCGGLAKGWTMQHRASSGGGTHGPGSWLQSGGLGWGQRLLKQRSPGSPAGGRTVRVRADPGGGRGGHQAARLGCHDVQGTRARLSPSGAPGPGQGQDSRGCRSSHGLVGPCLTSWPEHGPPAEARLGAGCCSRRGAGPAGSGLGRCTHVQQPCPAANA